MDNESILNNIKSDIQNPNPDAIIIGAGFSGLYQLYSLRNFGLSVKVIEAGPSHGSMRFD